MDQAISINWAHCELSGEKVGCIAVHIGARVMSKALASDMVASSTNRDLVAGSDFQFEERGKHMLKGMLGE